MKLAFDAKRIFKNRTGLGNYGRMITKALLNLRQDVEMFLCTPSSKGDYQKTKGVRSEQPVTTGKIQGFRKFDKVRYFGIDCFIKGRMSTVYAILMDIEGNKIDFSFMSKGMKTPKLSNCKRIAARSSQMVCAMKI